jgi:DegV family protein with EDD domain
MPRLHLVTDSSARFPDPDFLGGHPVTIIPMTIRGGHGSRDDAPGSHLDEFQEIFAPQQALPVAEPPAPERFAEIYRRLSGETDQILSIHNSSGMSATVNHARQASEQFLGRANIQIIDSQSISVGLGLLVQAAAAARDRGETLDEVVRVVRGMIPRLYLVFFLDDLAYLEHSGLVSRSQAILGNMLGILPFLTIEQGKLLPMEKVRSRPRAVEKLVEFVSEFSDLEHLGILYPGRGPNEETMQLAERIQAVHTAMPISMTSYGPAVATYVGLTGLGVVVMDANGRG